MPNAIGAERAVRRRVAVAAGDRHARLRQPELGPDHVHDALVRRSPGRRAGCRSSRQLRSSAAIISSAIDVEERPRLRAASGTM